MPNIWTLGIQMIEEAFNGPRTKDGEFDLKVDELTMVEKSVVSMRAYFQNLPNYIQGIHHFNLQGFRKLFMDFHNAMRMVYPKDGAYSAVSNDICEANLAYEQHYEEFLNRIQDINSMMGDWLQGFNEARKMIEKREETRKNYDHYDKKMEELYKAKKKNDEVSRNEDKYKIATRDYLDMSHSTYQFMIETIDGRFELLNPIIARYLEVEGKFFTSLGGTFKPLENIQNRFKNCQMNVTKPNNTYDPSKYIRGVKLGGDGGTGGQTHSVDNEIKERIKQSQQVKNTSYNNASNMNNKPNNIQPNSLQFDKNFGQSLNVNSNMGMGGNNLQTNMGTSNFNMNNNYAPTQIEDTSTLKVDNPYASINFNMNSNVNSSSMNKNVNTNFGNMNQNNQQYGSQYQQQQPNNQSQYQNQSQYANNQNQNQNRNNQNNVNQSTQNNNRNNQGGSNFKDLF